MKRLMTSAAVLAGLVAANAAATGQAQAETIFLSTQLRPIEEASAVRNDILKGVDAPVDYVVEEPPQFAVRMKAETEAGKRTISLVGALHGELEPVFEAGDLIPLDDLAASLADAGIAPDLLALGKYGTEHQQYLPWMQATYVMAANKQALQYLPEGAKLETLTYDQLIAWGKAMEEATGQRRIGFPAGPTGLMARFFEGYFYPSYTTGVVRTFKSEKAVAAWEKFKDLWAVVTPNSTSYNFMQEPLLSEQVWVAWDHVARLKGAISQRPDDFVVFPAPAGPEGRGYMPVVAGLAIPKDAPDVEGAKTVIRHLLKPETQVVTAQTVGFFPVESVDLPDDLEPGVAAIATAVQQTQSAPDALVSLLPVGLGDRGGEFNKVFMDAFQLIVLRGKPVEAVLEQQAGKLSALMEETKAPCWAPDAPSEGACPVE